METEVNQAMWVALKVVQGSLPANPSYFTLNNSNPLEQVSWRTAVLFANLLSVQRGLTLAYYADAGFTTPITVSNYTAGPAYCSFGADGYRLPTEGEWEYFSRAGTGGPFWINEPGYSSSTLSSCTAGTLAALESVAWFCANASDTTHPVGSKAANPWGLKDVHGNVWEWCWDWYSGSYPAGNQTDYRGPLSGSLRVIRGGGWDVPPEYLRVANRASSNPMNGYYTIGFRLLRSVN